MVSCPATDPMTAEATPHVAVRAQERGLRLTVPWTLVSTATSSVGSLLLAITVLRHGSAATFGYFGLAFSYYSFVLNLNRAVTGSPTILLVPKTHRQTLHGEISAAIGAAFVIGISAALVGLAAAPLTPRPTLIGAFALSLPALMVQDTVRYVYFALRRPRGAAAADAIWTLVQVAGFAILAIAGNRSAPVTIIMWGAAGAAAAAVMTSRLSTGLVARGGLDFVRRHSRDVRPLVVEMTALGGLDFAIALTVAGVGGAAVLGQYRAGFLLVAPFNVLLAATMLSLVPAGLERHEAGAPVVGRVVRAALLMMAAAIGLAVFAYAMPWSVGVRAFGEDWAAMRHLLMPWIGVIVVLGLSSVAFATLRIHRELRYAMVIRVALVPITVAAVAAAVRLDDARGAVVAYGATAALGGLAAAHGTFRRRVTRT